jgi:DNA-binding NarL/FixJ family response regulator
MATPFQHWIVRHRLRGGFMHRIRVLLVDDSPTFLDAASNLMADWRGIEVVGCAPSGREALEQTPLLQPDVVLVDLHMPEMNGLETIRNLKTNQPAPAAVLMTLEDQIAYRQAALAHGADGYVSKSDFGTQMLPLIRTLWIRKLAGQPPPPSS